MVLMASFSKVSVHKMGLIPVCSEFFQNGFARAGVQRRDIHGETFPAAQALHQLRRASGPRLWLYTHCRWELRVPLGPGVAAAWSRLIWLPRTRFVIFARHRLGTAPAAAMACARSGLSGVGVAALWSCVWNRAITCLVVSGPGGTGGPPVSMAVTLRRAPVRARIVAASVAA